LSIEDVGLILDNLKTLEIYLNS